MVGRDYRPARQSVHAVHRHIYSEEPTPDDKMGSVNKVPGLFGEFKRENEGECAKRRPNASDEEAKID